MTAAGPPVYDLTQQDADESEHDEGHSKQLGSGMGPYKVFGGIGGEAIVAPTPTLAPAPTTPFTRLAQHGPAPPWISDLLDSMATLHQKQDRTHVDVLEFGSEIKNQGLRLDTLELGMKEHTQMHESAKTRLDELERQVQDLKNQASRSPKVSSRLAFFDSVSVTLSLLLSRRAGLSFLRLLSLVLSRACSSRLSPRPLGAFSSTP